MSGISTTLVEQECEIHELELFILDTCFLTVCGNVRGNEKFIAASQKTLKEIIRKHPFSSMEL